MNICWNCKDGKVIDYVASIGRAELIYCRCSICKGTGVLAERSITDICCRDANGDLIKT